MPIYAQVMLWMIVVFGAINLVRFIFFMIGSDLYAVRLTQYKKKTRTFELPTFTVIIPAHNEQNTIRASLTSVLEAEYDSHKLRIIVADDGSTDATAAIVRDCVTKYRGRNVELISRPNAGKAHALNYAMRVSDFGELIMCLDADSSITPDSLVNAARHFINPKVVALSANVKIRPTGTLLNTIQQFEYTVCYQMKRAQTFFNIEYIVGGIGSTFRRSALERVGFYDTNTITEDIDLTMKLLRLGNKDHGVVYGADVVAFTESVLTITSLIKQRFRWKWGRAQTFEKNWDLFYTRESKHSFLLTWVYLPFALFCDLAFFLEPFILSYIIYYVVRYQDFLTLLSAMAVVTGYIAMNIIAEDTISWRQKPKMLLLTPAMYFLFYILSYAEYVALIRTYARIREVRSSIARDACSWEHVERAQRA